ncbi:MAG: ankyrin repeat protein [Akkermansiaceae bacterium]|jgi:ankyrin repeat protein
MLMQLLSRGLESDHEAIVNVIAQLITAGLAVNHQDSQGDATMHYAAIHATAKSFKEIGPSGPDFFTDSRRDIATAKELTKVVLALLKAGAETKLKKKEGMAPVDMVKGLETVLRPDK